MSAYIHGTMSAYIHSTISAYIHGGTRAADQTTVCSERPPACGLLIHTTLLGETYCMRQFQEISLLLIHMFQEVF
jgi:hypothetical protein